MLVFVYHNVVFILHTVLEFHVIDNVKPKIDIRELMPTTSTATGTTVTEEKVV